MLVTSVVVGVLAQLALAVPTPAELSPRQASQSIDKLIKAKGKLYFGTCTDSGLINNAKNAAVMKANFGQVTPENSMKVRRGKALEF